jgi:hypothetical protein
MLREEVVVLEYEKVFPEKCCEESRKDKALSDKSQNVVARKNVLPEKEEDDAYLCTINTFCSFDEK